LTSDFEIQNLANTIKTARLMVEIGNYTDSIKNYKSALETIDR